MKKLLPLLSVLFLISWGCEEQQGDEVDTTPPTVSISSHSSGQTVFEIVNLVVNTQDNREISKVEFFIDDSLVFIDLEEPYQYMWNTTPLIEDSEHIVKVISYDNSDNFTISQPIMLIVKNESSFPESSQITSIIFEDGVFIITWNQCTDLDFESYQLEKSLEPEMNEYEVIFTSQNNIDTVFIDNNIDPLISQYYRTTVSDTLGLRTTSQIVLSSLDPVPLSVDITLVSYTIDEMTVEWEESLDSDFKEYKLLYSQTESGVKVMSLFTRNPT